MNSTHTKEEGTGDGAHIPGSKDEEQDLARNVDIGQRVIKGATLFGTRWLLFGADQLDASALFDDGIRQKANVDLRYE